MDLGFVILLVVVSWLVIWFWAIFDASGYPDEVWRNAGESKTIWQFLILVLQFFGTLFYLLRVRPKLRAQEEHRAV